MRGARRDIGFFARVSRVALATVGKQGSNTVNTANTAAIWHTTLDRLETAPMDAVCKAWLQSANLTSAPNYGEDDIDAPLFNGQEEALYFTLQVPSSLARDVINTRWRRPIEDILAEITGQPVTVVVTNNHYAGVPGRATGGPHRP